MTLSVMVFSVEEQRRELEAVLAWGCFFRMNREPKAILRVLGERALKYADDPEQARMDGRMVIEDLKARVEVESREKAEVERKLRTQMQATRPREQKLLAGLTDKQKELLTWQPQPIPTPQEVGMQAARARELLIREYLRRNKRAGDICIWFPLRDPNVRHIKPYHLLFEPWPSHYCDQPKQHEPQHEIVTPRSEHLARFWNQIAFGFGNETRKQHQRDIHVLFSDESVPGKNDNERGFLTGSGEVVAAWELSKTLSELRINAEIMRSSKALPLLSRHSNAIVFLGSALNQQLQRLMLEDSELVAQQRFKFEWKGSDAFILDTKTEEPWINKGLAEGCPEKQYALVSLLHRDLMNQTVLSIAGTSTIGTEAASKFFYSDAMIKEILHQVAPAGEALGPFQMLLETAVHYETAFGANPIGWHITNPKGMAHTG
jgi:hypothetical protein